MDRRTKRQKLLDMANQSVSPNEAEIAKQKLETLQEDPKILRKNIALSFNRAFSGIGYYDFQKNEWVWIIDIKTSNLGGE
jgi:hypothetical protein